MKFLIITHTPHGIAQGNYFAYAPYVREMNIWNNFADEVAIVAPLELSAKTDIHIEYNHVGIDLKPVASMDLLSLKSLVKSLLHLPKTVYVIYTAMKSADHIHLRCPGNIGLLGCVIQILFPKKKKTAKYAGNWDPKSIQPKSYKLQRWILNNTFLTRNMQVLVYGEWQNGSKNIKPFFTATYRESDIIPSIPRPLEGKIQFLFVGSLVVGKRPLYAIQIIENLRKSGYEVALDLYGDGLQRENLEKYIDENQLGSDIRLMGNQTMDAVRKAYQSAHFAMLPSQSEGWPKAVAEAMFWGCFAIATPVSCVPFMLDNEKRGMLLTMDSDTDAAKIRSLLENGNDYSNRAELGMDWSRQYTLDFFQSSIKLLLKP